MEDIMIIRSSFMRRIISQIINKALKKQMPGVEVELKDISRIQWRRQSGGQEARRLIFLSRYGRTMH